MKKFNNINVLVLIMGVFAVPSVANAASLLEIYQQALQSDPQIHEAEARRLAALEAKPQARGVLFPQITAGGGWDKIDSSGSSFSIGLNQTVDITQETDRTGFNALLTQTLFRWDFDVLAAEDRLTSIHADRTAIARQLEQAKQRFEVGLIAITDVQESQASYDRSVANEIAAKRELATSRNLLREITGEYVSSLSAPKEDFPLILPEKSEREWVDMSLNQNLNLVASRLDEQLARDEISFRRTGHYPTVDLYYRVDKQINDGTGTNDGAPSIIDSDFDTDTVGIQFSIPIFSGGTTSSQVREAVYLHRASREQLQRVTRETERQSRDAYLGVLAEQSRVQALEQAVASSRTALEATQAGFDVGTRTIVDVLNSQFSLYLAITNYYQSRYDYILNVLRLKQAAGTLQVQDLEQIDQWLTERQPPEEVIAEEEKAAAASGS
jgi:outer membrane protein